MGLKNLFRWNHAADTAASSACGSACGAGDKPEENPAACGTACGAEDKPAEQPTACGAADKKQNNQILHNWRRRPRWIR